MMQIKDYEDLQCFDKRQLQEISWGLQHGIDVSCYANPQFSDHQMQMLRIGLCEQLSMAKYANTAFSAEQL